MRFRSIFTIISFSLISTLSTSSLFADTPLKTIAITQIVEHPAADAVREGILAGLKDSGYEDGKNLKIVFESAQGNPVIASQIAYKFVALKPDLIMPITTPSAQAIVKADEAYKIPIVFAAVTDPVEAGVVPSLTHPGGYITGATDAAPIAQQFKLFKEILPSMKKLGVIYNPGDNSSATPLLEARAIAKEMGLELIEAPAFKTADVPGAMKQLVGDAVDGVFVPLDNTVLSAMDAVLKIGFQAKIPVFSSDKDSVIQGALASSGYTHFDTGVTAGKMAAQVLEGKNPGEMAVQTAKSLNVFINEESAEKLGLEIPKLILETADKFGK